MELDRLCRLCAAAAAEPVFNMHCSADVIDWAKKYVTVQFRMDDQLPTNICEKCISILDNFNNFAVKCVETQITLKSLFNEIIYNNVDTLKTENDNLGEDDLGESLSIKSENFSDDDYNDNDDFIPISQLVKNKSRKRKSSRKTINKIKQSKKIPQSADEDDCVNAEDDANDEISLKSDAKKRKTRNVLINNSFIKFSCHICSKTCNNWAALKSHTKIEHDTKAKILCVCSKYLYTRHSITRHIVKHDKSIGFKCDTCDKTFSNEKLLQAHTPVHMPKDQYPHVCSHCAKRFATLFSLKIHERTHIPKELRYIHPCEICGNKFTSKSSVKAHVSAVHERNRPYVCDVCGHAFNNKGNLQDHRVLHSDEKLHPCPKCSKSFKTKGTLQRHLDCHGDTSYQCTQCPAILNSRRTLRMHMFVHDEMCRYICAFCNKGYKRRKSLKSHMNLHTGERPYSCLWCPRTFADNSNCRIHKKRMHRVELAEYEAIHGNSYDITKDIGEPRKIIYNMTFKTLAEVKPIIVPQMDIKPVLLDPKNEPQS